METGVAQAVLELMIHLPQLPSAGIMGLPHHAQLSKPSASVKSMSHYF